MMSSSVPHYPWYAVVSGKDVEQGDILQGSPVYIPESVSHDGEAFLKRTRRDIIIMTHSCDMQRVKPPAVLFCDVIQRSAIPPDHKLAKSDNIEMARKGQTPAFHVLAECEHDGYRREVSVVDFRQVFSLPFDFVKLEAEHRLHLRLLPPYREHLSQAFARFFMRVGLPSDIPSLR